MPETKRRFHKEVQRMRLPESACAANKCLALLRILHVLEAKIMYCRFLELCDAPLRVSKMQTIGRKT